jgi:hypothetical protein
MVGEMTNPETPAPGDAPDDDDEDEGPATTPFDNPWLLPVLFGVFFLWFAWDGFISDKFKIPGKEGTLMFNRVLAPVWGLLALWSGWRARNEARGERDSVDRSPEA